MPPSIITLLLFALSSSVAAASFSGKVIAITDGDTIVVLAEDRQQIKIRLAEIDAPEKTQAFGTESKHSLSDMCFRKESVVDIAGKDRYGRTIGRVHCFTLGENTGIEANTEQVRRGMAWVFDRYATDRATLYRIQDDARAARRGLWADSAPIPPWDWRKEKRKKQ